LPSDFAFGNPPKPPAPANPFGGAPAPSSNPFGAPPSPAAGGGGSFGAPPPSNPFGAPPAANNPFGGPPGGNNPFGGGSNPFAGDPKPFAPNPNPYASPTATFMPPTTFAGGAVGHQIVDVGPIMNHAMTVWQNNLGILVGATVIVMVIGWVVGFAAGIAQGIMAANDQPELAFAANIMGSIVNQFISIFLGIGQVQICLKLARYQPANIGDLFAGGPRFLPTLGISIILGIAIGLGMLLLIIPGIIVALYFWPAYYLVVDDKSPVSDSLGTAAKITEGNRLTTFLLALLGLGINILGLLACGIGLLFSVPLVAMLMATAYLMMSNQIPAHPQYSGAPAPQPMYR
jgi:hypothetical protein